MSSVCARRVAREDARERIASMQPRCRVTISLNTSRKSVVTARSRPSKRCSRFSPGHRPYTLPPLTGPPSEHHRVAMTMIGAAVAVLRRRAPELRHRQDHGVGHALAEVLRQRGDAAATDRRAAGDLSLARPLR